MSRKSGNEQAGHAPMIGELYATYLFDNAQTAKVGWETIRKRCRNISVNRWSIDGSGTEASGRVVTILTEEDQRHQFEKGCVLLGRHGREIDLAADKLLAMRSKRARDIGDGKRYVTRTPGGMAVSLDGRHLGPVRRPQG